MTTRTAGPVELLVSGCPFCEGPAFDRDGNLYIVSWESSQILRVTPKRKISEVHRTGGIPAGLAFHPDGSLWIADEGEDLHGLLRLGADGEQTIMSSSYEGEPLNGANDLVFDRFGTCYFSDPWGSGPDNPVGAFYRRFSDGRLERIDSGLKFPNGVALNADETSVYLAETYEHRILRYPIYGGDDVGDRSVWYGGDETFNPDGMAFDAEGYLHTAVYGGSRVAVLDPEGHEVESIAIPGPNVTNCAFGGPDNKTLVVTEIETESVYRVEMVVPGQPLNDGRNRLATSSSR